MCREFAMSLTQRFVCLLHRRSNVNWPIQRCFILDNVILELPWLLFVKSECKTFLVDLVVVVEVVVVAAIDTRPDGGKSHMTEIDGFT